MQINLWASLDPPKKSMLSLYSFLPQALSTSQHPKVAVAESSQKNERTKRATAPRESPRQ